MILFQTAQYRYRVFCSYRFFFRVEKWIDQTVMCERFLFFFLFRTGINVIFENALSNMVFVIPFQNRLSRL